MISPVDLMRAVTDTHPDDKVMVCHQNSHILITGAIDLFRLSQRINELIDQKSKTPQ